MTCVSDSARQYAQWSAWSPADKQQSALVMHRGRELLIGQRTMLANALRGHLAEYGLIAAQGLHNVAGLIAIVRNDEDGRVPDMARRVPAGDRRCGRQAGTQIAGIEAQIMAWHKSKIVAVALANKTARIAWANMTKPNSYRFAAATA